MTSWTNWINTLRHALKRGCPRCKEGALFPNRWTLTTQERCPACHLPLAKNDSGDGPAVFMVFILGFLLVPLSIGLEIWLSPSLWVHATLWGGVGLGLCAFTMQPIKTYVIHLQYRHNPETWRED